MPAGTVERVVLGEVVEQRAFHAGARQLGILPRNALAHRGLERVQIVEALAFGQVVIEHHGLAALRSP